MQKTMNHRRWDRATLQALQAANHPDGDSQFATWQQLQLQQFIARGFPTQRHEQWKYTDVSAIIKHAFVLPPPVVPGINVEKWLLEDAYNLVFINGHYVATLSNTNLLPAGVIVSDLSTALQQQKNVRSKSALLQIPPEYQTPFTLLNGALLTGGLVITVTAGVHLDCPLHLLHLTTDDQMIMTHPHHIITASAGSEMTILEEYVGATNASTTYFNNVVTQLVAEQNAQINYYKLQRENAQAFHIANTIVQQKKGSRVTTFNVTTGGQISRDDLNVALNEERTECKLFGLYHLADGGHVDHHSHIDHKVSHGVSQQNYKGIIDGKARAVFNGKVMVHRGALQTVARQSNRNLLLSAHAEIDTKPELEIYADDVQCTHGATVGKLDEQALFYLRSRGINAALARHLLTCAFADEILMKINQPAIANKISQHVTQCLATTHCHGGCQRAV